MIKPLDPGLPNSLLALWLISELFVGNDLFQLREHLSPDHYTEARLAIETRTSGLSGLLVRPPVTLANKSSKLRVKQVPRLRDVCQRLRELVLMHRQDSTIKCTVCRLGLHGGDVVVH